MVALIAAVIVTAVTPIGTNLTSVFNMVANAIWSARP
jgi:Flp pilus assembly pilin Flp